MPGVDNMETVIGTGYNSRKTGFDCTKRTTMTMMMADKQVLGSSIGNSKTVGCFDCSCCYYYCCNLVVTKMTANMTTVFGMTRTTTIKTSVSKTFLILNPPQ